MEWSSPRLDAPPAACPCLHRRHRYFTAGYTAGRLHPHRRYRYSRLPTGSCLPSPLLLHRLFVPWTRERGGGGEGFFTVARCANNNTLNNNETQLHPLVRESSGLVHKLTALPATLPPPPPLPLLRRPILTARSPGNHREAHRGDESRVTGMRKVTGAIKVPVVSEPTGDPR